MVNIDRKLSEAVFLLMLKTSLIWACSKLETSYMIILPYTLCPVGYKPVPSLTKNTCSELPIHCIAIHIQMIIVDGIFLYIFTVQRGREE